MRLIPDSERRARLARRHAIVPWLRLAGPETATRAMTVLHVTEAASVYPSLLARVDDLTVEATPLTEWLGGHRISTVYPSPAMKEPR